MTKQLTDKQKLFIEALFTPGIDGDPVKAKIAAGYSENVSTRSIVAPLREEILEATREFLASRGPKAAMKISEIMDNPTQLGVRDKMAAAKDILDRIGVVKTEKVEVVSNGVFLIPKKDDSDD